MVFRKFREEELLPWYEQELCTTFIPQECTPLSEILRLWQAQRYELWGLFEGDAMRGYAALRTGETIPTVLLDYLGVSVHHRNGGLGSEILRLLKAQGRPIVLESEEVVPLGDPTENALRERRMGFYVRNGFTPVYRMATCGVAFQALLYDESHMPLSQIMRCHRLLYGEDRADVCVPLLKGQQPPMPYWMQEVPE